MIIALCQKNILISHKMYVEVQFKENENENLPDILK